jgi:hypothetical protein
MKPLAAMKRGRRLWYALLGVGVSGWLLVGVAAWFELLTGRTFAILYAVLTVYLIAVRALRRFVDEEYARRRRALPTAPESLKGYPKWW